MAKLSKDWLFEDHIDLEYKSYVLLAYLQDISRAFEVQQLYPHLGDLVEHYNALINIKAEHQRLENQFPKELKAIKPNFQLEYEKMGRPETLDEIIDIIEYAIPVMEKRLKEGRALYEELAKTIHVSSVGVLPLQTDEGYILMMNGNEPETLVYNFNITLFSDPRGKYRAIHTSFLADYRRSISNTPEQIKLELIRVNRHLPNPATLTVESEITLPFHETLFPIAKRAVVKFLAETG
ncbi:MAG: hypothetical protein H6603_07670 [Flavobacteriales bacterium]|nr:hypothetical protein [Flavobacteriales bacterium]MCB9190865.1 hypothetical protein [Flavobacteriales bacterium]MCB9204841.1 hypothetical protein [Flavobacteriales bacterium]